MGGKVGGREGRGAEGVGNGGSVSSFTSKGLQNNKHLPYIINTVPVGGKVGGREGRGAEGVWNGGSVSSFTSKGLQKLKNAETEIQNFAVLQLSLIHISEPTRRA